MICTQPCDTCPYRRSTPVGLWHSDEYYNLLEHDSDTMQGMPFACHQYRELPPEERALCGGWAADQKRRGVPSIQFRIWLITHPKEAKQFEEIDEKSPELYSSIQEMCDANIGKPPPRDKRVVEKLLRKTKKRR